MKFCPECGRDLKGSTKFCPECGFNIASLAAQNAGEQTTAKDVPEESIFDEDILQEPATEKTTRELGTNLEDMVEKILQDRGFSTETRTKIRGTSGQLNEIDIMATRTGSQSQSNARTMQNQTRSASRRFATLAQNWTIWTLRKACLSRPLIFRRTQSGGP